MSINKIYKKHQAILPKTNSTIHSNCHVGSELFLVEIWTAVNLAYNIPSIISLCINRQTHSPPQIFHSCWGWCSAWVSLARSVPCRWSRLWSCWSAAPRTALARPAPSPCHRQHHPPWTACCARCRPRLRKTITIQSYDASYRKHILTIAYEEYNMILTVENSVVQYTIWY